MEPLTITLIILACTIIAFMSGKVPFSIISTGIIISLILTKVMKPEEAFSGFINKNVIMFTAMFVIGAGLTKTSILTRIQNVVVNYKDNTKMLIFIAALASGILALITSGTAAAAIMLPLLCGIANEVNISRSKILYPAMIVANLMTAMTFLGQGASNLALSDIMMEAGGTVPFSIWDFTYSRIPFVIITILYVTFIAWKLLPDIPNQQFNDNFSKKESVGLSAGKETIAVIIIVTTILGIILAPQIKIDMFIIACVGACALVLTGILTEKEALASIHLPTIFLFAGVLTLSNAIKITGAGDVVADMMIKMLGDTTNPYLIMSVFFIVPLILTQLMSNLATVMIFVPLVSVAGVKLGIDPRALVMGVIIASSTSILTPMAAPAQTIIMAPGGYELKHYLKAGLPLVIILTIVAIISLPLMFPF